MGEIEVHLHIGEEVASRQRFQIRTCAGAAVPVNFDKIVGAQSIIPEVDHEIVTF